MDLTKTFLLNLLGAALGAFIGALIVQVATIFVGKFKPRYRTAYLAAFLGYLSSYTVGFFLGLIFASMGIALNKGVLAFFLLVGLLIQATVYNLIIKGPQGESVNFGRACLISLVQFFAGIVLIMLAAMILNFLNIRF